jgi:hypothetical protein
MIFRSAVQYCPVPVSLVDLWKLILSRSEVAGSGAIGKETSPCCDPDRGHAAVGRGRSARSWWVPVCYPRSPMGPGASMIGYVKTMGRFVVGMNVHAKLEP